MKLAVVLFNLGGPDSPEAVRPFLYNLFRDPAIIAAPAPIRLPLAWLIARRRAPIAREIYDQMGGRSPILPNTQAQADALEAALQPAIPGARVFIAMRYWKPFAREAARAVADFAPDQVMLLPLYPQFSTSTSGSSIADWNAAAQAEKLAAPARALCCFPEEHGFVEASAALIMDALDTVPAGITPRVLLSAHGLPERTILRGDPYQHQVERSAAAIMAEVARRRGSAPDWLVTYQSRVGPLRWIGPYTDAVIEETARDGRAPVVYPVAFVSEHSETLVELDIEYAELAHESGAPAYVRVPTVQDHPAFIAGLARSVIEAMGRGPGLDGPGGRRFCPKDRTGCPCGGAAPGG